MFKVDGTNGMFRRFRECGSFFLMLSEADARHASSRGILVYLSGPTGFAVRSEPAGHEHYVERNQFGNWSIQSTWDTGFHVWNRDFTTTWKFRDIALPIYSALDPS